MSMKRKKPSSEVEEESKEKAIKLFSPEKEKEKEKPAGPVKTVAALYAQHTIVLMWYFLLDKYLIDPLCQMIIGYVGEERVVDEKKMFVVPLNSCESICYEATPDGEDPPEHHELIPRRRYVASGDSEWIAMNVDKKTNSFTWTIHATDDGQPSLFTAIPKGHLQLENMEDTWEVQQLTMTVGRARDAYSYKGSMFLHRPGGGRGYKTFDNGDTEEALYYMGEPTEGHLERYIKALECKQRGTADSCGQLCCGYQKCHDRVQLGSFGPTDDDDDTYRAFLKEGVRVIDGAVIFGKATAEPECVHKAYMFESTGVFYGEVKLHPRRPFKHGHGIYVMLPSCDYGPSIRLHWHNVCFDNNKAISTGAVETSMPENLQVLYQSLCGKVDELLVGSGESSKMLYEQEVFRTICDIEKSLRSSSIHSCSTSSMSSSSFS